MHFQWVLLRAVEKNNTHKVDLIIKKGFNLCMITEYQIKDELTKERLFSCEFHPEILVPVCNKLEHNSNFCLSFQISDIFKLKTTIIQLSSWFKKLISVFVNTWWCWKRPRWEHLLKCNLSCKQHSSVRFFLEPECSANLRMRRDYRFFQRTRPLTHHNYMF